MSAELGDHIVVQGGTFYNDAVLRSMELLLNKNVIRPDIAGLMGAYGAAILALETVCRGSRISFYLLLPKLAKFTATSSTYHCQGCGNHCQVTVQRFADGTRYFTGNRCERAKVSLRTNIRRLIFTLINTSDSLNIIRRWLMLNGVRLVCQGC
jgi:hypothetical protein